MAAHLKKIIFIFGGLNREVALLGAAFLVRSILDLIGLGVLGPFVALALDSEAFFNMEVMLWVGERWVLPDTETLLIVIGSGVAVLYIFKAAIAIALQWVISRKIYNQQKRLRIRMLKAYLNAPFKVFLKKNSAEHVQSIIGNVTLYTDNTLIPLFHAASELIVFIVVFFFLAWVSLEGILLFIVLIGGTAWLYIFFFRRHIQAAGDKLPVEGAAIIKNVRHAVEGIREIRVLSAEKHFTEIFSRPVKVYAKAMADFVTMKDVPRHCFEMAIVLFTVLFVLFYRLQESEESLLPLIGVFGIAAIRLAPSFYIFLGSYNNLRFSQSAVDRLYNDLHEVDQMVRTKNVDADQSGSHKDTFEKLELRGVRFKYPNTNDWVLSDLNLALKKGEAIGIIGASGSGKTTLADIMLGLLDPQEGECRINGQLLNSNKRHWWRQVAYLPQRVFILDDTLRRNIALGVPDNEIDETALHAALEQAHIADLIEQLPQGLNTTLGESGVSLSGGQRQRVALARAFYHGRNFLVMDESTSALDSSTEKDIVNNIKQLKGKKTMIIIAHRLSTIRHCDRIIQLEAGRIVAQGSYEEVVGDRL